MKTAVRALALSAVLMAAGTQLATASGGRGMTWSKHSHNSTRGTDHVGCGTACDAYAGDTLCSNYLPVLCFKPDGAPNPGITTDFYNGWTGGHIGLTLPVQGSVLTSLAVANQLCQHYFGPGYRMAEFHDGGGGWNWHAFANVSPNLRFWTYINDSPANCWNP